MTQEGCRARWMGVIHLDHVHLYILIIQVSLNITTVARRVHCIYTMLVLHRGTPVHTIIPRKTLKN